MFFFFSSRRRHTRLTCDWSSDVCSSDLVFRPGVILVPRHGPLLVHRFQKTEQALTVVFCPPAQNLFGRFRSEEHTSELQSHVNHVCRLLLEKKKKTISSTRASTSSCSTC